MEFNLFLRTIRRGWLLIILTALVAANVSLVISYLATPIYQTTARFVVSPNSGIFSNSYDLVSSLDTLDRRSIVNTYKELVASPAIYGKDPEIQKMDPDTFLEYKISAIVVPDTNILQLNVEGPDPRQVVVLANAISTQSLTYINEMYTVYNFSMVDQPQIPVAPIRPQPIQNAGLAFLFGGLIGVVLAFSREQLQNTIDKLRERTIIDVESSAYTRSYFERRLLEEVTQRPDTSLLMGIIDFRGLEELTGVLPGPIAGQIMQTLTQKLKNELRGRDIVGRWSSSRLAVILPATPSSAVESAFKRIQVYLAEPIFVDKAGDIIVHPDPCIGVVTRGINETSEQVTAKAEMAVEKASGLQQAGVVFLSRPNPFELSELELQTS